MSEKIEVPKQVVDHVVTYWSPSQHGFSCPVWTKREDYLLEDTGETLPGPAEECDCPRRTEAHALAHMVLEAMAEVTA